MRVNILHLRGLCWMVRIPLSTLLRRNLNQYLEDVEVETGKHAVAKVRVRRSQPSQSRERAKSGVWMWIRFHGTRMSQRNPSFTHSERYTSYQRATSKLGASCKIEYLFLSPPCRNSHARAFASIVHLSSARSSTLRPLDGRTFAGHT
jgi:hypothetical protein